MDLDEQQATRAFLRRCNAAYEAIVERVLRLEASGNDEKTLRWLHLAASVGWMAHPGRFADDRLEAVALRIGQALQADDSATASRVVGGPISGADRRHVLHVATTIYETGGHTRLIENWVKIDDSSRHSLVLLDQRHGGIRPKLARRIQESGGDLIVLPGKTSLLDRARQLRRLAQSGYDLLILHVHPNDVVPLVALATAECPPVALMNHADHVYWIGVSVADAVIDFREHGLRLSQERRGARHNLLATLPMDLDRPAVDRPEARAQLGLSPSDVMLFSMGSAYKYEPNKRHDFFRTLHEVLNRNPTAKLYIVGVGPDNLRSFGISAHERMVLPGVVNDPSTYQAAADLYLEGFPFASFTALFETVLHGVCPVLMFDPPPQSDLAGDAALEGLITRARDEEDYVERVTALINDPAERERLGQAVAQRVASAKGSDVSSAYLHPIYDWLGGIAHRAVPPSAQPTAEEKEDLELASFNIPRLKSGILAGGAEQAQGAMTFGQLLSAWAMAIRMGDMRLSSAHVGVWLRMLRRIIFKPQPRPKG